MLVVLLLLVMLLLLVLQMATLVLVHAHQIDGFGSATDTDRLRTGRTIRSGDSNCRRRTDASLLLAHSRPGGLFAEFAGALERCRWLQLLVLAKRLLLGRMADLVLHGKAGALEMRTPTQIVLMNCRIGDDLPSLLSIDCNEQSALKCRVE